MNADLTKRVFISDSEKFDLILSTLQRLQDDLHIAKCEIKTAVRDVARNQEF